MRIQLPGKNPKQLGGAGVSAGQSKFNSGINDNPTYYQSKFNPPKISKEDVSGAQSELKEWKDQKDNYGRYYGAKDATLELKADCHAIARKSETKQLGTEVKRVREADTKQVEQVAKLFPTREEQNLRMTLAGHKANAKVQRKRQQYSQLMQKWA